MNLSDKNHQMKYDHSSQKIFMCVVVIAFAMQTECPDVYVLIFP